MRQTDRQTGRQTVRQTDRQTDNIQTDTDCSICHKSSTCTQPKLIYTINHFNSNALKGTQRIGIVNHKQTNRQANKQTGRWVGEKGVGSHRRKTCMQADKISRGTDRQKHKQTNKQKANKQTDSTTDKQTNNH